MKKGFVWDIEASNLLDGSSIDYTSSPYKLKESFKLHCIVVVDKITRDVLAFYDGRYIPLDGREHKTTIEGVEYELKNYTPQEYTRKELKDFPQWVKENCKGKEIIAHNQINYDLLVCKTYFGMDYTVEEDSWMGEDVNFKDTLVISKTLNPDRFGGHSLDVLSSKTGVHKVDFRPHILRADRFKHFAPDMLYYNIYDCLSNLEVYFELEREAAGWDWEDAISLEKSVADIVTRQSHRGFMFDKELAEECIAELDSLLEERRQRVEPLLPKRRATQAFMKNYTPPKIQYKKDGTHSANLLKWVEKHEGKFVTEDEVEILGKRYKLPIPLEPLVTEMEATIDDTTHIKEWLVSLGWEPTEWKEKDLTLDSKRVKLTKERYEQTVERYVKQTTESSFKKLRCEHLGVSSRGLKSKLLTVKPNGRIFVRTSPSFTVGQEKELCPDLERISVEFPYVKDVVEYLTYKHRRNSILGGGLEWEDGEEAEKGYLSAIREDGRIPTPADTCGAATSRMKHRLVANIPRTTSLYGEKMRRLFGTDKKKFFQIGYDFDSLEARQEAHYCFRYEEEPKSYCNSLLQEKPHDVHTMMAERIAEIIGRDFSRDPAKNVKYGCTYGAQAAKVAKTIGADLEVGKMVFDAFWEAAEPLALLKDRLKTYWETRGEKKYILGIDGRKVPTRAAHAILNSLFQSAGVICAKRAMVIHDKKLREEGMTVDFFTEDWKNRVFAQQLIAYHDEAQLELSKELAKFKMFDTKEEAQEFKHKQETIWSDIQESPRGGYFIAYSRVGELASESVREAGEYYNLKVPLSAGYSVGYNWADCH